MTLPLGLVHAHCLAQYEYLEMVVKSNAHISVLVPHFIKYKPFQGTTHNYQRKKVFDPPWTVHLSIMLGPVKKRLNTSEKNVLPLERHQAQHLQVVLEAYLEILSS